jgi:DNA polymerase-1
MSPKHLYLIDGHALAYRSYFAMLRNPLTNSKGIPTGAVYGTAVILMKLIETYQCPYVAIVFDSAKPTFRHKMYDQYKANRVAMPEDMVMQMPLIYKLVEALNIPVLRQDGLEADDIIAHLTRKAVESGFEVSLVTKDKDLMQLVSEKVRMLAPENGGGLETLGPAEVRAKMGVPPSLIGDLLALTGDSSDNVPGVPGIGPKNALKILEKAGTVDALLNDPSCLDNPKLQAKIEEHKESLRLSKELVTLHFDFDGDVDIAALAAKPVHRELCIEFFKEMEFRSLLKTPIFDVRAELEFLIKIPVNTDEVRSIIDKISKAGSVCIDTETTSPMPREAKLVGITLAVDPSEAFYIPVGHTGTDAAKNLPSGAVLDLLKEIIESPSIAKIGQNLKYDYQVFRNYGLTMRGIVFDAMIAAYLLDPGKRQYGLEALTSDILGYKTIPIEALIGKGKDQKCFSEVPVHDAARYSGEDVVLPIMLREKLLPVLEERNLLPLFGDIEIPLIMALAEMEWQGILIDQELLSRMSREYHARLGIISEQIYALAGAEFNLNSPAQISDILFNKLMLPKSRKNKTGLSTDVDALEKLATDFPIAERLLDYREVQKLLSTYIDALPVAVSKVTGRVHTSFNQTIAATGRLSSTNPNLQNIPVRTDDGKRIREAFIAPEGFFLVSADYSQIELRILAHISGDSTLRQAFADDQDIHTQTAAAIYGIFPAMVTPEMRRAAKTINFGLMYGMGPVNLSRQLKISIKDAQEFIETYFRQFPTIRDYMSGTIDKVRTNGYAETLLGRRRYLPEIVSESRQIREGAERTAINTPIQGTAADIIKIAMVSIIRELPEAFPQARMLLQVHDELVFEIPERQADDFKAWVCGKMVTAYALEVPIRVDAGVGKNWILAH